MAVQEVLDLHGVNVLAAGDDNVLLAVNQPNEAVFVHARHVARKQPAVFEYFGGGFGVVVIAGHNAGSLHPQLADFAVFHIVAIFAYNARLPTITRNANGAHVVHVANAKMHTSRAGGFGQTVVRVVIVVGENLQPALNQALRNRLRAHVHKTPLVKLVIVQVHFARFNGVQNVLYPRHQQPHGGALLGAYGAQNVGGLHAAQNHGLRAGNQVAHPVELRAGVVQRRNAQEHVIVLHVVMDLLHFRSLRQAFVVMQNRLGEARGTAAEVNGGVVAFLQGNHGVFAGTVRRELVVAFCERGAVGSYEEQQAIALNGVHNLFNAAHEFGTEHQHVNVGQVQAVLNFGTVIAEIQRHGQRACFQHAEINGQPFQAVHHENAHFVTFFHAARKQQVGKAVRFFVKHMPGDFATIRLRFGAFDQVIIAPRDATVLFDFRVALYQRYLVAVFSGVPS